MSAKVNLERKVRWVIALIVLMLLIPLTLAVRSYVASVREKKIHTSAGPTDERLIAIDGHQMLIEPGHLGQAMSAWAKSRNEKTLNFELSDRSFVPNSAVPSQITVNRVREVALVTKSNPMIMVHILMPENNGNVPIRQLDEQRATALRDDLVTEGVTGSHVTIEDEQPDLPTANSQHLAFLLSK